MEKLLCRSESLINKRKRNKSPLYILVVILLLFFNSCNKDDSQTSLTQTPGTNEIFIIGMAFNPANKTIAVGTTLKWINKDNTTHTVTSGTPGTPSSTFDSGNLSTNGEFSFTFNTVGTYNYYCRIHTSMTGTITVQ